MDTQHFKEKLLAEKARIEKELATVGQKTSAKGDDWVANAGDVSDDDNADMADRADDIKAFESNIAIMRELEERLEDVVVALKKIDDGTYGICEKTGEQIPHERLEANPAARTIVEV